MLKVTNLKKHFKIQDEIIKAVDDVSFEINHKETYALVGQSGSGKSSVGKILSGLLNQDSGFIKYNGEIVKNISKYVQMIFQDSISSFNPRRKILDSIAESLDINMNLDSEKRFEIVRDAILKVGLIEDHLFRFPHELSGGQKQRINIARAIISNAKILIADESFCGSDASMKIKLINLFKELQEIYDLTYIVITHDLSIASYISDRIGVMLKGKLIEEGSSKEIMNNPKNDYTKILINSIPKIPNFLSNN